MDQERLFILINLKFSRSVQILKSLCEQDNYKIIFFVKLPLRNSNKILIRLNYYLMEIFDRKVCLQRSKGIRRFPWFYWHQKL